MRNRNISHDVRMKRAGESTTAEQQRHAKNKRVMAAAATTSHDKIVYVYAQPEHAMTAFELFRPHTDDDLECVFEQHCLVEGDLQIGCRVRRDGDKKSIGFAISLLDYACDHVDYGSDETTYRRYDPELWALAIKMCSEEFRQKECAIEFVSLQAIMTYFKKYVRAHRCPPRLLAR